MRRMTSRFYAELAEARAKFGLTEYNRNQILPAVMSLLVKHNVNESELLRDAANAMLDNAEKADDAQPGIFDFGVDVALGERNRIRRGRMNIEQVRRRKRLIDHNKVSQDVAWAQETGWLNTAADRLEGQTLSTVVEDVMQQQGTVPAASASGASATAS